MGEPRPPAPTSRILAFPRLCCPSSPHCGSISCLEYLSFQSISIHYISALLQPVCPFSGTALARRWLVLRLQSPIRNGQPGCIRSAFLCHFDQAKRVEKSIFCCTSALLLAFRLPPAELRSAAPHSGPSQNLLRHHFVITCIFRAPPPALSGGGYVRLVAA